MHVKTDKPTSFSIRNLETVTKRILQNTEIVELEKLWNVLGYKTETIGIKPKTRVLFYFDGHKGQSIFRGSYNPFCVT